jgi:hypothetical protein
MLCATPGCQLLATLTPFGGQTDMGGQADGFVMDIPPEEWKEQTLQEIREAYGVPVSIDSRELMGGESLSISFQTDGNDNFTSLGGIPDVLQCLVQSWSNGLCF